MEYRESLEERGLRSAEEIDRKVAVYRRQLEIEFGLSDTTDDQGSKKTSSGKLIKKLYFHLDHIFVKAFCKLLSSLI